MTDIEVVDINDNTNKEEIKENVKEDIKENIEEDIKENIEEEIKEDVKEEIKENVKEEDIKEKKKVRKDLKEKGTCPDCGMEMTQHSLRYTHKKYCKAKQISTEPVGTVENKTLDKIEKEVETPPPSPPKLQRAISRIADAVPVVQENGVENPTGRGYAPSVPPDDQIAQYLLNKKKELLTKKKKKCLY